LPLAGHATTLARSGRFRDSYVPGANTIGKSGTSGTTPIGPAPPIVQASQATTLSPKPSHYPGEPVIAKNTPCAFARTDLETRLHAAGVTSLVVAGVITNNSVEATVRTAGCLGFDVYLVEDACFTFARKDWNRRLWSAKEVHPLSLANLDGEYCTVIRADQALAWQR
jgi:nicotinamidase-related amidase